MGLLSEEKAQELASELELGLSNVDIPPSETSDVKPEVEAAPAAEEKVEAKEETPEVPAAQPEVKTETGKSEEQAEAKVDDGSTEDDSVPSGHRVPYKRFKGVLEARNKYRTEADEAQAQLEAYKKQMEMMRNEVAAMRNLQPATPVETQQDTATDELDRLLNGTPDLPPEVKKQITAMEARLYQQEVQVERERLRREVAQVADGYGESLRGDVTQVLYNAVQRDPNVDLNRVAEQYTSWLAKREEEAIARYLAENPQASAQEAVAATGAPDKGVPARPKRTGTGASSVMTSADTKKIKTIAEGSEALMAAMKNGAINLFG
tara:strand:- start:153 stop:1115 length:963 start_codon:yes stop_codon:yes gene_type:complete